MGFAPTLFEVLTFTVHKEDGREKGGRRVTYASGSGVRRMKVPGCLRIARFMRMLLLARRARLSALARAETCTFTKRNLAK